MYSFLSLPLLNYFIQYLLISFNSFVQNISVFEFTITLIVCAPFFGRMVRLNQTPQQKTAVQRFFLLSFKAHHKGFSFRTSLYTYDASGRNGTQMSAMYFQLQCLWRQLLAGRIDYPLYRKKYHVTYFVNQLHVTYCIYISVETYHFKISTIF